MREKTKQQQTLVPQEALAEIDTIFIYLILIDKYHKP